MTFPPVDNGDREIHIGDVDTLINDLARATTDNRYTGDNERDEAEFDEMAKDVERMQVVQIAPAYVQVQAAHHNH